MAATRTVTVAVGRTFAVQTEQRHGAVRLVVAILVESAFALSRNAAASVNFANHAKNGE